MENKKKERPTINSVFFMDRKAMNALFYLISKLGKKGIPLSDEDWETYLKHTEMVNKAIDDSKHRFNVGKRSYPVSTSWLKFAHQILIAVGQYYSNVRTNIKKLQQQGKENENGKG